MKEIEKYVLSVEEKIKQMLKTGYSVEVYYHFYEDEPTGNILEIRTEDPEEAVSTTRRLLKENFPEWERGEFEVLFKLFDKNGKHFIPEKGNKDDR